MCNRCSGWVHSKCSGLQNAAEYHRIKNWACISCRSPPTPQIPKPLPLPMTTKASDGDPFTILQFNANGIGNKQVELGDLLERHKVKVAVIQESKLTLNSRTPNRYSREIEYKLSKRRLPTDCQKGEKILRAIILKAASHHIKDKGGDSLRRRWITRQILQNYGELSRH